MPCANCPATACRAPSSALRSRTSSRAAFRAHLDAFYPGLPSSAVGALGCSLLDLDTSINTGATAYFPPVTPFLVEWDTEAELEAYVTADGYGEHAETPAVAAAPAKL